MNGPLGGVSRLCLSAGAASVCSAAAAQTCAPRWSNLGGFDGAVRALAVYDDGSGPALYAGGSFATAHGAPASGVARWRNGQWSGVESGVSLAGLPATVSALTVFDPDGAGPGRPVLCLVGAFDTAGGAPAANIASWNGQVWSPMASSMTGPVLCATVFDRDGAGPGAEALYIGGQFTSINGQPVVCVARRDGATWTALAAGVPTWGFSIAGYMDGLPGPGQGSLYLGSFERLARWDGAAWSIPGGNIGGFEPTVFGLAVFDDDGGGPRPPGLYVSGSFTMAGGLGATGIARWDGSGWEALGAGLMNSGFESFAYALAVYDDGSGPALYAGGPFTSAGGVAAARLARWSGSGWSALPSLGGPAAAVRAMAMWDEDGPGPQPAALFVGGGCACGPGLPNEVLRWGCCYANCDSSTTAPILNVSDFTCFLNRFAAAGGYANCDGSTQPPVLNVADFTCFLNRFAAGCP